MKKIALLFTVFSWLILTAQETFPVNDVKDDREQAYAFTNAILHVDYKTKLENATLLIRAKKVERVGAGLAAPEGYTTIDLKGKHIYPSLIDLYTHYGAPQPARQQGRGFFNRVEQITPKTDGAYNANDAIKSHIHTAEQFKVSDKDAKSLRELGFGAVLTSTPDGIARGSSALVTLADDTENNVVLNHRAAAHYSFRKGSSQQSFPSSTMGAMALLRQTHFDAVWYASLKNKPFTDQSLESWSALQTLPQIFEADGWMSALRADKIGDELGVQYIIKGGGDEYQRIQQVKSSGAPLIVPVNFPDAYDVEDLYETRRVSLAQMKHWELAPSNPGVLVQKRRSHCLDDPWSRSEKNKTVLVQYPKGRQARTLA